MPQLLNTLALSEFFSGPTVPLAPFGKSLQKSYRFLVTFMPNLLLKGKRPELFKEIGAMPMIRGMHIKGISIPQYSYDKQTQFYGPAPRSFPVMKHDGFEVKIDMEEDDKGTVGFFISWLTRLAIEPTYGIYTPPDYVKLPMIGVVTENDFGVPIACYTLHDAFYLNASGPDLDYSDNSSVKYSITFNVDIINSFFPQASIFQKLTSLIL